MPRLNILSFAEQEGFDNPRELSGEERKIHFRINSSVSSFLKSIRKPENKLVFALTLYHFKISKKFFAFAAFNIKDIKYVSHLLQLDNLKGKKSNLGSKVFHKYKEQIAEYLGYQTFDQKAKVLLYSKTYKLAMQYVKPKVIFNDCIELLLEQKIEIPKYNTIRAIIIEALQEYKNSLLNILEKKLTVEIKEWLDELLLFDIDKSVYKLTLLKGFYQSVKPKEIRFNTSDFITLQEKHDKLQSIIKELPINARGIEYFATTVIKSDVFRIKRRM
ncbi:DUF4158 domain-containing protein [Candidatus Jidaibacter acanthamoebae]|nr:DUF4158 domain-containing protein [Candidatus Jidaibacter acanthamoeba]